MASGDQVEVLTSRSQTPQPEWLNFGTTARARTKISAVIRRLRKDTVKGGENKVLEAIQKANLDDSPQNLDKLAMYYGFNKRDDLYYTVEKGEVVLPDNLQKILKGKNDNVLFKYVKQALRMATKSKSDSKDQEAEEKPKPVYDKKKPYVLKEEEFERNYVIADCCMPIPGDES